MLADSDCRSKKAHTLRATTQHHTFFLANHSQLGSKEIWKALSELICTTPFHPLWSGVPLAAAFDSARQFTRRHDSERWKIHVGIAGSLNADSMRGSHTSLVDGAAPPHYSFLHKLVGAKCAQQNLKSSQNGLLSCTDFVINIIKQNKVATRISSPHVLETVDTRKALKIFMIAGEPSGDNIGGSLMIALLHQVGAAGVTFSGVGG